MKKTISVGIPTYNSSKFILECLESVVNQSVKADTILICDNRSTDNTVELINKFIKDKKNENIQLVINETNIGAYNNFKKCKELCKTNYLVLLGSDDRLLPNSLKTLSDFLNSHPDFALVGGKIDIIDEKGELKHKSPQTDDLLFNKNEVLELFEANKFFIPLSSIMLNMDYINKMGFWDEICTGKEERYWARVLKSHPIAELGVSIAEFRVHKSQSTWQDHANNYPELSLYYKTNVGLSVLETDPIRHKQLKTKLNKWAAKQCFEFGKVVWQGFNKPYTGIKYWSLGIGFYPKIIFSKFFIKTVAKTVFIKKNHFE